MAPLDLQHASFSRLKSLSIVDEQVEWTKVVSCLQHILNSLAHNAPPLLEDAHFEFRVPCFTNQPIAMGDYEKITNLLLHPQYSKLRKFSLILRVSGKHTVPLDFEQMSVEDLVARFDCQPVDDLERFVIPTPSKLPGLATTKWLHILSVQAQAILNHRLVFQFLPLRERIPLRIQFLLKLWTREDHRAYCKKVFEDDTNDSIIC